ncbi:MAG: hypothetical protein U9N85_01865 [Bacteroidota bacterium]|nr:hypothetical protein [Bacteroidota bacterium]
MARILVTCVGSGVGQSVIDSLNLQREHYILGCDMNRNVYAYNYCDEFSIVPGIYSDGYVEFLADLAAQKNIDIIIPGHDHELELFGAQRELFHKKGVAVLVSEPDLIKISRDKYKWYKYFSEKGCNIVPTRRVKDFKTAPDNSFFPAIAKPSGGSASQGISILSNFNDLKKVNDEDIIQPYLFPEKGDDNYKAIKRVVDKKKFVQRSEISIQLIFSKESEFEGIFISKNSLKSGVPVTVEPIRPEEFEQLDEIMKFVPICMDKKVKGPVNIQGRITEKGLVFFEMNMRFTGITGNRAQIGFNEVEFLVNNFLDRESILTQYSINKTGARQVACTTVPLEPKYHKLSVVVLSTESVVVQNFLQSASNTATIEEINVIVDDRNYATVNQTIKSEKVNILKASDRSVMPVYSRADVLLSFEPEEISENYGLFLFKQIKRINKAIIPKVYNISASLSQENNGFLYNMINENWKTVSYYNPAVKYKMIRKTTDLSNLFG